VVDVSATQKTTYPAILGQVIEQKRKEMKLGQSDLAKAMGISQPSWSRIEKGQSVINAEQLNSVAEVFGEEPHTLLSRVDERVNLLKNGGVDVVSSKDIKPSQDGPGVGTVLVGAALAGFLLALLAKR